MFFGVTLRLLVINISSSSPAINTAAYYQHKCHNLQDGGTTASNAGVYEKLAWKLAILDEYLVDHCWMVMCNHHLDDRLSLLHAE